MSVAATAGTAPLSGHRVYRTADPAVASREAGLLFARNQLRMADRTARMDALTNLGDLSGVAVSYVTFGSAVQIERVPTTSYTGLMMPLAGRLTVEHQGPTVTASAALGAVFGSGWVRMGWSADCRLLSFRISPERLSEHAGRLVPAAGSGPVRFGTAPLDGNTLVTLRALAQLAADTFDASAGHGGPPASVLARLRDSVLTSVLLSVPSSLSADLVRQGPAGRSSVRAAVDLIAAEDRGDLTLTDIAARSGVGLRALELGFRRELDVTPLRYLRVSRLRRVRDELAAAGPDAGVRVGEVAQRWGFFHLGRFARAYREESGVSPAHTLHDGGPGQLSGTE
jgi:AraC-like DNA-binding protein